MKKTKKEKSLKVVNVKLYPTDIQEELLTKLFGCYRFTYNQCLEYKIAVYNSGTTFYSGTTISSGNTFYEPKTNISQSKLQKYFHSILVKENEFLQEFNSNILKVGIQNMFTAFDRFYQKISGFPNFKSKTNEQSISFIKIKGWKLKQKFYFCHIMLKCQTKNIRL